MPAGTVSVSVKRTALATRNIYHHDCRQQVIYCCVSCRLVDFVDDDPFLLFVLLLVIAFFVHQTFAELQSHQIGQKKSVLRVGQI